MPVGKGAEALMSRVLGDDLPGEQTGYVVREMLLVLWKLHLLCFGWPWASLARKE
jgi:hypothetical protein